jgi:hypothetical protein
LWIEDLLLDVSVRIQLVGKRTPNLFERILSERCARLQIVEPCELLAKPLVVSEYQHRDVRHLDSNRALRAAADSRSLPSTLADGR